MLKTFNKFVAAIAVIFAVGFTAAPAQAMDMKAWSKEVAKKVAQKQRYPRSALAREIEGRAKVRLVVAADGAITAHEIVEETGENILDNEIPKLVERLSPLPALPDGKTEMTFVLPLNWRLN